MANPTKNWYGLWVMDSKSPQTNLGNGKLYGLSQSMGYLRVDCSSNTFEKFEWDQIPSNDMGCESYQIISKHRKYHRIGMKHIAIPRACTLASSEKGGGQRLIDVGGNFLDCHPGPLVPPTRTLVPWMGQSSMACQEHVLSVSMVNGLPDVTGGLTPRLLPLSCL
jgi:hypothetical protein